MAYTAYVLTDESRNQLLERFPPMFVKTIAHHITVKFGVPRETPPPEPADITVVGTRWAETGLQVLVCRVNGEIQRPDEMFFHITWSLNPENHRPVDSNRLLHQVGYVALPAELSIDTTPTTLQ